jgi:hypothetical protein
MGNLFLTILENDDPVIRKDALEKLIGERRAVEVLQLTGISVLSDDPVIRRIALQRLDDRGDASRVITLIRSWRTEGCLMNLAGEMNAEHRGRAAEIEAAFLFRQPLSSAVSANPESAGQSEPPSSTAEAESKKAWWKFW